MNKIYNIIGKLRSKFETMAYGLTNDKNVVDDAVQELMLYFLQMNPETLKRIYKQDGELGLTRYGAVALRRSLDSPRSAYFYKYRKYYTKIDGASVATYETPNNKHITNIPDESYKEETATWQMYEKVDQCLDKVYWYDKQIYYLYYEGETLDSLAKKTGISRNSLFTTIDNVRKYLKKKLSE